MCDKNKKIPSESSELTISPHLFALLRLAREECVECRQPLEDAEENETWQYFGENKYCYDCWETLELETQL